MGHEPNRWIGGQEDLGDLGRRTENRSQSPGFPRIGGPGGRGGLVWEGVRRRTGGEKENKLIRY